jgi:Fe-S cluster biogenesis protein NfuA
MNPISIYAEMTPNPMTMKFVANRSIHDGESIEFNTSDDYSVSPLAEKLLNFPFVENVFIASNFITVTRNEKIEWDMVALDVREFLTDFFKNEGKILNDGVNLSEVKKKSDNPANSIDEAELNVAGNDIEKKIIDALDEFIRPAVEGDGGSIDFRKFEDGKVTVVLRGSCSGCPSATTTLKHGVESLLISTIPEVKEVVAQEL